MRSAAAVTTATAVNTIVATSPMARAGVASDRPRASLRMNTMRSWSPVVAPGKLG